MAPVLQVDRRVRGAELLEVPVLADEDLVRVVQVVRVVRREDASAQPPRGPQYQPVLVALSRGFLTFRRPFLGCIKADLCK